MTAVPTRFRKGILRTALFLEVDPIGPQQVQAAFGLVKKKATPIPGDAAAISIANYLLLWISPSNVIRPLELRKAAAPLRQLVGALGPVTEDAADRASLYGRNGSNAMPEVVEVLERVQRDAAWLLQIDEMLGAPPDWEDDWWRRVNSLADLVLAAWKTVGYNPGRKSLDGPLMVVLHGLLALIGREEKSGTILKALRGERGRPRGRGPRNKVTNATKKV